MAENPRIEELRRRVQLDPASIAFAALAEEFRRMGRHEEAIETCRAGLQRHPAYLSARVTLGRALIETGDYSAAREELETVLRSAPENLAAIRGLAQIHERLGQSTEMDPHVAAALNAEVERVTRAAATAAQAPPPPPPPPQPEPIPVAAAAPDPVVVAAAELVPETAHTAVAEPEEQVAEHATQPPTVESDTSEHASVSMLFAETAVADQVEEHEDVVSSLEEEPAIAAPDPVMLATLARLERFLVAIDAARHP
jgi:tetratricopeptide (TPR) repeat protein